MASMASDSYDAIDALSLLADFALHAARDSASMSASKKETIFFIFIHLIFVFWGL